MHGWGCAWLGQKLRYAKSSGVLVCLRVERWVTCLVGMVVSWTSKVGGQNWGGGGGWDHGVSGTDVGHRVGRQHHQCSRHVGVTSVTGM